MTTYSIAAPNGKTYDIEGPPGATQEQVAMAVLAKNPEAGIPMVPKSGGIAALKAGFENLKGDVVGLAGRTGLMDVDEAERKREAYKYKASKTFQPTEEGWLDAPGTKLAELAGGSAPYMAAPVVAGGAAVLGGAPALAASGLAGLASLGQFTATNVGRQADEGKKLRDTDLGSAAAAAIPMAALDMISLRMAPGLRAILGAGGKQLAEKEAVQIAQQTLKQKALDYAAATGKAMTAEGLTETAQQVLERAQAGLKLNDDKARSEYWDSFIGGAALAGAISPVGRYAERGKIETEQATQAKEKNAAMMAAKAKLDAERAAAEQAAGQQRANQAPNAGPQLSAYQSPLNPPEVTQPGRPTNLMAQPDMFGGAEQANEQAAPEQVDPAARKAELAQQIRTLEQAKEEQRAQVAAAATPEESMAAAGQFKKLEGALVQAQQEFGAIKIEAAPEEKLARAYAAWEKAKELGDVDVVAKQAARISELKAAGAQIPAVGGAQTAMPLRKQQNVSEGTDSFNQRVVGPEMAAGREQARAQRERTVAEEAALRRMGRSPQDTAIPQARQERASQLEVEDMEAGRMDTTREDQRTLFDDAGTENRFVDATAAKERTREQFVSDFQRARAAKDPKAAQAAIDALRDLSARQQSIQANMGVPGSKDGNRVPLPPIGEQVQTGPARPSTNTPGVEARPTRRSTSIEDLQKQLVQLPQQIPPEAAPLVQRLQSNLRAVARDPQRAEDVSRFLYGLRTGQDVSPMFAPLQQELDILDKGGRSETETIRAGERKGELRTAQQTDAFPQSAIQGRTFKTPGAFNNFLAGEAVAKMRKMAGIAGDTISRAMQKIAPLQKRIEQLTENMRAEQDKYDRTKDYGEVMASDADAKHAAAQARFDAVIQRLDAELVPLQTAQLKAQLELKEAVEYARDINQTIAANRAIAGPVALQKIEHFQQKLVQELKNVETLSSAYVKAKSDLERAAKNQKQRVTTKRAVNEAAGEAFDAAQERAGVVQSTRDSLASTQARKDALREERTQTQQKIKDTLAPVEKQRDSRLAKEPTYEAERTVDDTVETQRRDKAAGEARREQQARMERLDAIPGERVDQSKYRAARDAAPADTQRDQRKALLLEKAGDEALPQTTRDKAKRLYLQMEREDTTREQRSTAQAEIDRLTDSRIPELRQKVAESPTPANKQELAKAVRSLNKLQQLVQRAKRETIEPKTYTTEPVEPGERLAPRKVGPLVKKERIAGNIRTGNLDTEGERNTPSRNKVQQAGTVRSVTPGRAVKEGNEVSQQRTAKQELAAEKLEREQEAAAEAQTRRTRTDTAIDDNYVDDDYYDPSGFGSGFDGEYEASLFRTSTQQGAGMRTEAVSRLADRVMESWTNTPPVKVVATEADLPKRIQDQAKADKMTGKIPGLFDPDTGTVFLVAENLHTGNDVALTIAHEVAGHYGLRDMMGDKYSDTMQRLYNGNPSIKTAADARMKANPRMSQDVAVEESLAEMAETQTAKSGTAATLARIFHAIKSFLSRTLGLKNVSDAEVRQIVANARRHVKRGTRNGGGPSGPKGSVYRGGDAVESVTDGMFAPEDKRSTYDRVKSTAALTAEMNLVDMRAPLRDALSAIAKDKGDPNGFEQAMYYARKGDQRSNMISAALTQGALKLEKAADGSHTVVAGGGRSYKDFIDAVSKLPGDNGQEKMKLVTAYMVAQRVKNKGIKALDSSGANVTMEQLNAMNAQIAADPALKKQLDEARKVYNEFNSGMMQFMADSGALPKESVKAMLKDEDYVPFYRVKNGIAELDLGGHIVSLGDVRTQPYLKELKGGDSHILPVNESLPRNVALLVDKAMTNLTAKSVAYMLQDAGAGKILRGKDVSGTDILHFTQEPDPKVEGDDGHRWIRIDTTGTPMEHIPAELLVKSLEGSRLLVPASLRIAASIGDVLRSGVTRTPMYLLRQLWRDPQAATFTGGLNYNPLTAVLKSGREYIAANRGKSETHAELIRRGLIQNPRFTGDVDDIAKLSLELAENKSMGPMNRLFKMMDDQALLADSATRALVFENAKKNGLSDMQADLMTMESMNFHKRGLAPTVQYAGRLIPFMNAQIQGLNVLIKAARGRMPFEEQLQIKQKFYKNAALLATTGFAYALAMEDDETFKNARPKDRYTNFFLNIPGVDAPLKLPVPYEAGYFFSAGVAMVDALKDETDGGMMLEAARDIALGSVPGYSSKFVPQIVKPLAEVYTNKSFFSGLPIESQAMQGLAPEQRFRASTTEAAKEISKLVPYLSPVQIEHLISGYLGALPIAAMAGAGSLFSEDSGIERPTRQTYELPIIGSSFQRKYGGADAQEVYDWAGKAKEAKQTLATMQADGTSPDKIRSYLEKNRAEIAASGAAQAFIKQMGELNKAIRQITNSTMDPDMKRDRIEKLEAERQRRAEAFQKVKRSMEASAAP